MKTDQNGNPSLEIDGPIDFDGLKAQVQKQGPLILGGNESTVRIKIDVVSTDDWDVATDLVTVVLLSGATSLSTLVSREIFERYPSIGEFAETFFREPHRLFAPSGELAYIKEQIDENIGVDIEQLLVNGDLSEGFDQSLSERAMADPWLENNLMATLNVLLAHRGMLDGVRKLDGNQTIREAFPSPNDLFELMVQHYDLGFLTARLVSENFVRFKIEPLAVKGVEYNELVKKRTAATGKSSNGKRHQRVEGMLSAMEELVSESPAIGRIGIGALAKLAIEDCAKENPKLWRQGKGQRVAYLDEMKSDLRYKERFFALKSKTA